MPNTIETRKLTRRFGNFVAVDRVDLSINSGEVFGLLGPNAAGKSTIIRLLAGILRPSSGEAKILALDLFSQTEQIKRSIGYVAQYFGLYPDLSVIENIDFYGSLYGVDEPNWLAKQLELYGLNEFRNKKAGLLSGGYKRRLALACATSHDPDLIFLDEPTAGIDPVTRKELWELFYQLSTTGKTLFVTTHYMEEAERCNRVAFLDKGRLVAQGTPGEIRASLTDKQVYSCEISHNPELTNALMNFSGIQLVNQFGNELRIIASARVRSDQLEKLICDYHAGPFQLKPVSPSIEDAFMSLTSHGEEQ
jgi:ABC-type multidrug transport system ATPase subunit